MQTVSNHVFSNNIGNSGESGIPNESGMLQDSGGPEGTSMHSVEEGVVSGGMREGDWMNRTWCGHGKKRTINMSMNGLRRPLAALSTNTLSLKKKEIYSTIAMYDSAFQYDPVYTCNNSATIFSITPSLTEIYHSTPADFKIASLSSENNVEDMLSNINVASSLAEDNTLQEKDTLALSSFVLAQFRTKRIATLRATTLGKRIGRELTKLSSNTSHKRAFPNNKRTIIAGRQFRRMRQKATEDEVDDLPLESNFFYSNKHNAYSISSQKPMHSSCTFSEKQNSDSNAALKSETSSDSSLSSNIFSPLSSSRPTSPSTPPLISQRSFPENIPIHPDFFRYYLAHPRSTYSNGNPPIQYDVDDLYNPRYIKGVGINKMGMCPICCESVERGGQGKEVWLKMKISAFWYYFLQNFCKLLSNYL
ncbi:unnamed protein product [Pneumocystis jirovecii]|uniref:Transcription regulator Rua1 C-terminal domain-containing protein n=1 Tax=Pneumocystis jirovecii TaxID=42068 RepID=L0PFB8_PNEJI|nr:unnamed protein product [Pneumocystis jirovecii]